MERSHVLSSDVCTGVGVEIQLLEEDARSAVGSTLCPKHSSQYLVNRFQHKCAVADCFKLGQCGAGGVRWCPMHEEVNKTPRRSSRSRSRVRKRTEEEAMEVDQDAGLRRRVRHEGEGEERDGRGGRLLEEIRGIGAEEAAERPRRKGLEEPSPGRTPKSSVQKSLARLGLVDSPDRREVVTTLEEFMAQFVDGKTMGLEEEDIRNQMAASSGMTVQAFTQVLYDQASEEQRKGTKGLTKFLAKWRRQLAAEKGKATVRSPPSSWSLVSSPEEAADGSVPCILRRRLRRQRRAVLAASWP